MKGGGGEKEKRFVLFLSIFLSFVNLRNSCGLRALVFSFFFPFFAAFVLVFFVFVLVLFVFVLSFFGFC